MKVEFEQKISDLQKQIDLLKEHNTSVDNLEKERSKHNSQEHANTSKTVLESCTKEIEDRERRKSNLVWFGIPESDSEIPDEKKVADSNFMNEMGEKVFGFNRNHTFKSLKRLGKGGKGPRPLLTTMNSNEEVRSVLRLAKEMGQEKNKQYAGISVKRDMTPLEREENRKLVLERNRKRTETIQAGTNEVWVIRGGRVIDVTRRAAVNGEGGV